MGKWMARFLKEEGASITIIGRNPVTVRETGLEIGCHATTDLNAASQPQAVIISVAIDSFEEVVKNLVPCTTKNQYIFDVTSVKTMPVEIMNRYITRASPWALTRYSGQEQEASPDTILSLPPPTRSTGAGRCGRSFFNPARGKGEHYEPG